jgi:5-formyltetrahydrofolate cyclo-ligase
MSNPGPALSDLAAAKATARREAFARRKAAHAAGHPAPAARLGEVLAGHRGLPLAAYVAMRSEIDPMPAMADAHRHGPVALPVVVAPATPLRFRRWQPGIAMADGGFGTLIPASGDWITPRVLVVPLVAFDRRGNRLGYGGGFYDRTLAALRAEGPVLAIGFAWGAQEDDNLPLEATDQPLDLIVTEAEVITPAPATGQAAAGG